MKDRPQKYIYLAGTIISCVIVAVMTALIIQARFFSQQAREMLRLKEEYANYVQGLRRVITEYQNREPESVDAKKKIVTPEYQFSAVNRDPSHLRTAARSYMRTSGVVDRWSSLDNKEIRVPKRKKQPQHIVRKPRTVSLDGDLEALHNEHTFTYPLAPGTFRVSSPFGPRRMRGRWGFHYGLDLAAPYGTPVKAVAHGVIIEAQRQVKGFGTTVVISHPNKSGKCRLKTRYAHLSCIDERIKIGAIVEQGQIIGRVGNTGHVKGKNGVHLHIEVLVYGKRVDPLYFFQQLRKA